MKLYLENKSNKTAYITLCGESIVLPPKEKGFFDVKTQRVSLSAVSGDEYDYKTVSEKRGFTVYNKFIAVTSYEFDVTNDCEIRLYCENVSGPNLESYQRFYAETSEFSLPQPIYCVKNESAVRAKMGEDDSKAEKVLKKAEKYGKAFAVADKFDDILLWIFAVILGVVFFCVGSMIVPVIGGIVAVLLYVGAILLLNTVIKKIGKSMEKITEKVLDKTFSVLDKSTVANPCKEMPDMWKDDDSYFDNEYISAVFKHSLRREQL